MTPLPPGPSSPSRRTSAAPSPNAANALATDGSVPSRRVTDRNAPVSDLAFDTFGFASESVKPRSAVTKIACASFAASVAGLPARGRVPSARVAIGTHERNQSPREIGRAPEERRRLLSVNVDAGPEPFDRSRRPRPRVS